MRKKSFLFMLFAVCLFALCGFGAVSNTSHAYEVQSGAVFEISNSGQKFRVQNLDLSANSEFNTWLEVLDFVKANKNDSELIELHFNNFNLSLTSENQLSFNKASFIITGQISSNSNNAVFGLTDDCNLIFNNITILAQNTTNIVEFFGKKSSVVFDKNVSYSNMDLENGTYFVSYVKNNTISASNCNTNLKVSVPTFELENEIVVNASQDIKDYVKIYSPNNENYFNNFTFYNSRNGFVATSFVRFEFDLNGGYYSSISVNDYYRDTTTRNYIITYAFGTLDSGLIEFEEQGNATNSHASFEGIFGKIKLNETIYYFDLEMLNNFINAGENFDRISEYFATTLDDVKKDYSIKYYASNSKTNLERFLHFKLFQDNNLRPTYVFKWKYEVFQINFETDCETNLEPITLEFNQEIPELETLVKEGYIFDGWWTNSSKTNRFNYKTMPANNLTLYAKWIEKTYNINFETSGGNVINSKSLRFGEEINLSEVPEREGYIFDGWFTDSETTNSFDLTTMPAHDITVYAKWTKKVFNVFLHSNASNTLRFISSTEYGEKLPAINADIELGFKLEGLYTSKDYDIEFDLTKLVVEETYIYAKYIPILYEISFETNYDNEAEVQKISAYFKDDIELPSLNRREYIFDGWFYDNNTFENSANLTKMLARNVTLYAKWTKKQAIDLNLQSQTYLKSPLSFIYQNETEFKNIRFFYFVDDEWTTDAPTEVGKYDVRAIREEDDKYLAVDVILKDGFIIMQKETNIIWLIALLYFATIFEIIVSLVVRIMLKRKLSATFAMIGSIVVSQSQFVNLIISGLMCLAGFVYMIYQLVVLSRSINNENFTPSKQDNRNRFKEDLRFQSDSKNHELDFETTTKTDESFGDKYTNDDIEKLLRNDDYKAKIRESRGKFAEISDDEDDDEYSSYEDYDSSDDFESENGTEMFNGEGDEENYDLSDDRQENVMPQRHYDIENERNLEKSLEKNDLEFDSNQDD